MVTFHQVALAFPARVVRLGDTRPDVVQLIQRRLNAAGCGPVAEDGAFTKATETAVRLFQARFSDADGVPLKVDGVVGPITWAALFAESPAPQMEMSPLAAATLANARREIGVREEPPGSNRGRRVDEYLRGVGLNPERGSFAWCAAFVHFCFGQAASQLGRPNPVARTAGVLAHWNAAERHGARRIRMADAVRQPALVKPGHIFVIDFGRGAGHTGLVTGLQHGKLLTIEGNTNDGGSRDGIGVFARSGRTIGSINKGYIEYV